VTNLRPAQAADLPAVVALIRELAEFEKLPGPDAAAEARFHADFAATPPRFELLVAEGERGLIGYALYFMTYSTFLARPSLYLEDLYVHPDERSAGIGARFLQQLAAIAVERGCGRFEWTVLDWNVRAQSFYRSLGATLLPEWTVCRLEGTQIDALARR
jgi:GNAT superfamily N-acetyltransferase